MNRDKIVFDEELARETKIYEAGYNKGLKDAYERVLIKLDIIDDPHKIIKLYPQVKEN